MVAINTWEALKGRYENLRDTFAVFLEKPENQTVEGLVEGFRTYVAGMEQIMDEWDRLPDSNKPPRAKIGALLIRATIESAKQELAEFGFDSAE